MFNNIPPLNKLRIPSFDGITDHVDSAGLNQFKAMDNWNVSSNGKMIYVRGGQKIHDLDYPQITGGTSLDAVFELEGFYFYISGRSIYYKNIETPAGFTELLGPVDSHDALPAAGRPNITFWRGHAIITVDVDGLTHNSVRKVYVDSSGVPQVRTAGLPFVFDNVSGSSWAVSKTAGGTQTISSSVTSYVHYAAATYRYEYTLLINGVEVAMTDLGPISYLNKFYTSTDVTQSNYVDFGFAALDNTSDRLDHGWFEECWDLSNIKLEWYILSLDTFTIIGGIPGINGTAGSINDATDSTRRFYGGVGQDHLSNYKILYDDDGTLSKDPPPCSLYHMTGPDNVTWYLNTATTPNRAYQSVQNDADSTSLTIFVDTPDPITGGGYFGAIPIIFTEHSAHRVEGLVDSFGTGISVLRTINGALGCISHRGIVKTPWGLLYPSTTGIAFTDGFVGYDLSRPVIPDRWKLWTHTDEILDWDKVDLIQGVYWPKMKVVLWTVSSTGDGVTSLLALDLSSGIQPRLRTYSGFEGLTSIQVLDGEFYWGDEDGYLYRWDESATADDKKDLDEDPADWVTKPILFDLTCPNYDFGDPDRTKIVSKLYLEHRYASSLGLTLQSTSNNNSEGYANLLGSNYTDLGLQSFTGFESVGEYVFTSGGGDPFVAFKPNVPIKRNFPLREQRCKRKSVKITNLYREEYNDADYDTCSYDILDDDPAKYQAIIDSGSWPADVEGMYIALSSEDYKIKHKIIERTDAQTLSLEVLNPSATPEVRTVQSWKIYEVPTGQRPYLENMAIEWVNADHDYSGTDSTDS